MLMFLLLTFIQLFRTVCLLLDCYNPCCNTQHILSEIHSCPTWMKEQETARQNLTCPKRAQGCKKNNNSKIEDRIRPEEKKWEPSSPGICLLSAYSEDEWRGRGRAVTLLQRTWSRAYGSVAASVRTTHGEHSSRLFLSHRPTERGSVKQGGGSCGWGDHFSSSSLSSSSHWGTLVFFRKCPVAARSKVKHTVPVMMMVWFVCVSRHHRFIQCGNKPVHMWVLGSNTSKYLNLIWSDFLSLGQDLTTVTLWPLYFELFWC